MSKYRLLLLVSIFTFNLTFSQKQDLSILSKEEKKEFEIGNAHFAEKNYSAAYHHLKSIQANHSDDLNLKYMVGVCGIFVHSIHEEALKYLEEVKSKNSSAKNIDFYIAMLYHKNYQFDKALGSASQLLTNPKIDPNQKIALEQIIIFSKNGKILMQNPVTAKIESLGAPPNSEAAEYSPVVTSDEEEIIFTYRGKESTGGLMDGHQVSNLSGEYFEDVFMSKKIDGKWLKPESIASINTKDNDAAIALSNDQKLLFLYKYTEAGKGDIYVSEFDGAKFSTPEALKGEVNTNAWEGSLSISVDQQKIYFSSDRPGGKGGKDLYVATKMANGSWGNVKNMGDKINTALDEDAPFIHPDGRTLVFSSEGHNTMGDFDIFSSDMDMVDSSWASPLNLGYPINTTDDDLFYVLSADGKRGYYASEKKGGSGDHDIYVVEPGIASVKNYLTVIKGKVTEDLFPFSADITVVVSSDGRKYTTLKSNSQSGHYLVDLPSGYNYKVNFTHPLYGEKTFDIMAEKVDGYAEKVVNVNFGMSDTSTTDHQTVLVKNISVSGSILLTENINDPATNTRVYLTTEDGKTIDSARTNEKGYFNFKNLESDKKYLVTVDPDDVKIQGKARYFLASEQGAILRVSNLIGGKKFVFKNLPLEINALPDLYSQDGMTFAGKMVYGEDPGKPFKNTKINVTNQFGDVIISTTTNQFGAFAFKNLPVNQNYIITIDETEIALPANTKISLKNKNGIEIKNFYTNGGKYTLNVLATEKSMLSELSVEDNDLLMALSGYIFDQDKKPIDNLKLLLNNADGAQNQTTKTDAKGKFAFKNLKAALDYLIKIDETDPRLKAIQKLYIADSKGTLYKELIRNLKGEFEFRSIEVDKIALGEFNIENVTVAAIKKTKSTNTTTSNGDAGSGNSNSSASNGNGGSYDDQIIKKYGNVKIQDLKYMVQIGAYRHPENFKGKFLKNICGIKQSSTTIGDIKILVADKEFDNLNDANEFAKKLRSAGQKDAFITGEINGKRYYLGDLLKKSILKG